MTANARVVGPGQLSMSFRIGQKYEGVRLIGDLATVTVDQTGSCLLAEITTVSVMGYVEVCEATILQHVSGPPIENRAERRSSTRYRFGQPVTVNVSPVGTAKNAVGEMADISSGGCGIRLPKDAYRKVGGLIEAELRFEPPGMDQQMILTAKRRNTRAHGPDILMGMIWSQHPGEAAQTQRLAEYLSTRTSRG